MYNIIPVSTIQILFPKLIRPTADTQRNLSKGNSVDPNKGINICNNMYIVNYMKEILMPGVCVLSKHIHCSFTVYICIKNYSPQNDLNIQGITIHYGYVKITWMFQPFNIL